MHTHTHTRTHTHTHSTHTHSTHTVTALTIAQPAEHVRALVVRDSHSPDDSYDINVSYNW